jgi:hypothetical protein
MKDFLDRIETDAAHEMNAIGNVPFHGPPMLFLPCPHRVCDTHNARELALLVSIVTGLPR